MGWNMKEKIHGELDREDVMNLIRGVENTNLIDTFLNGLVSSNLVEYSIRGANWIFNRKLLDTMSITVLMSFYGTVKYHQVNNAVARSSIAG